MSATDFPLIHQVTATVVVVVVVSGNAGNSYQIAGRIPRTSESEIAASGVVTSGSGR